MLWAKHTGQREMGKGRGWTQEEVKARSDRKPERLLGRTMPLLQNANTAGRREAGSRDVRSRRGRHWEFLEAGPGPLPSEQSSLVLHPHQTVW